MGSFSKCLACGDLIQNTYPVPFLFEFEVPGTKFTIAVRDTMSYGSERSVSGFLHVKARLDFPA